MNTMAKKTHFTGFDFFMLLLTAFAVFLFAFTFRAQMATELTYLVRITTIVVSIIGLIYFGLTRHTLRKDLYLLNILIGLALFLSLIYYLKTN